MPLFLLTTNWVNLVNKGSDKQTEKVSGQSLNKVCVLAKHVYLKQAAIAGQASLLQCLAKQSLNENVSTQRERERERERDRERREGEGGRCTLDSLGGRKW